MRLRRWQKQCTEKALLKFRHEASHFQCLATPGGGKTVMASSVANMLFAADKIDLVLCLTPSCVVMDSFRKTLETLTKRRLDGRMASSGDVMTYQAMCNKSPSFWEFLETQRTLVIFDEIHHCAGDSLMNTNAWGHEIVTHIQGRATYTLALTGTPWRSDQFPISLASYSSNERVLCDFEYGLYQAIADNVCRTPHITAIDNENIKVVSEGKHTQFSSFTELFKRTQLPYQKLLENKALIHHVLKFGVEKLNALRKTRPDAAGLIVAASVSHAKSIRAVLLNDFNERSTIVSYDLRTAHQEIHAFRGSSEKWIISVGMISEGTDIPRLQVCCYLTRVKTELYFRQVLGRVMRQQGALPEQAFLFMPAEPTLIEYAQRVSIDIPGDATVKIKRIKRRKKSNGSYEGTPFKPETVEPLYINIEATTKELSTPLTDEGQSEKLPPAPPSSALATTYESTIGLFGRFQKRLIKLPERPPNLSSQLF